MNGSAALSYMARNTGHAVAGQVLCSSCRMRQPPGLTLFLCSRSEVPCKSLHSQLCFRRDRNLTPTDTCWQPVVGSTYALASEIFQATQFQSLYLFCFCSNTWQLHFSRGGTKYSIPFASSCVFFQILVIPLSLKIFGLCVTRLHAVLW